MRDMVVKSTVATIQNGAAKADGKFWITENDINFEPFNKGFGLGPYKFDRSALSKVDKCVGKGAGLLPITTDAIEISLNDGNTYQFIISNSDEWVTLLSQ